MKEILISVAASEKDNVTPLVVNALQELKLAGGGVLAFEKGEYHFYKEGSLKKFYAVSNNTACDKYIVFPIIDFDGITIDGNGSVFVFHEVVFPFVADNSKNVVIKNFISDCAYSPMVELRVAYKNDDGFKLEIDKEKSPFYVKDGVLTFKREWGERSGIERKFSLHATKRFAVEFLLTGDSKDSVENLPALYMLTDAYEEEDGVYFKYRNDSQAKCIYDEGEAITSLLDGGRDVDVIFLNKSENIKIQNITIRRGIGMGVIGQLCRDIEVDGFSTDSNFYKEYYALTADSMHFINCTGNLEVHNCHISHTADDAINVHGMYTVFDKAEKNRIYVHIAHQEQEKFNLYCPDDRLTIIDNNTFDVVAGFRVKHSEFIENDGFKLVLDGEFEYGYENIKSGFLVEKPYNMPNLHLHHNHFEWYPHMRISGGGNIVIEDNRLEHGLAALLALDLMKYWYESGRINNLIFRNNYLNACNAMGGESFIQIGIDGVDNDKAPKIHKRIEISGNTFENIKKYAIKAGGVQELIIKDNIIKSDKDDLFLVD